MQDFMIPAICHAMELELDHFVVERLAMVLLTSVGATKNWIVGVKLGNLGVVLYEIKMGVGEWPVNRSVQVNGISLVIGHWHALSGKLRERIE